MSKIVFEADAYELGLLQRVLIDTIRWLRNQRVAALSGDRSDRHFEANTLESLSERIAHASILASEQETLL